MDSFLRYLISFKVLYLVIGGFFFYLVGAFIGIIFIPTLEMSDNWCEVWAEKRTGYGSDKECVKFKDKI